MGNTAKAGVSLAVLLVLLFGGYWFVARTPGSAADQHLIEAARNSDVQGVKAAIKDGAEVNYHRVASQLETWKNGDPPDLSYTAMHLACERGSLPIVQALVEAHADVNAKNQFGNTPLLVAANFEHKDIVVFLLANGADAKATNVNGTGVLAFANKRVMKPVNNEIIALLKKAGATK